MIASRVVDFPAPFGPISPTISPRVTSKREIAHRGTPPYRTSRASTSSTAGRDRLAHGASSLTAESPR